MRPHFQALFVLGSLPLWGVALAGDKVEVCHVPPGNPENFHTITVSENALDVHLDHGDLAGSCSLHAETLCSDGDACTIDVDGAECATFPRPQVDCSGGEATVNACDPIDGCLDDTDPGLCSNGIDDDDDGLTDCADPDCAAFCSAPECDNLDIWVYGAGCDEITYVGKPYKFVSVSEPCTESLTSATNGWGVDCGCADAGTQIALTLDVGGKGGPKLVTCSLELPEAPAEDCATCE